jgi:hypothetical protein
MAAVLRAKMAGHQQVEVRVSRFEEWEPPAGGVDLVFCAQAWLWVDRGVRCQRAHGALAPGGAVAIFGHSYDVVDDDVKAAIWEVHARLRTRTSVLARPGGIVPDQMWFSAELADCGLFTDMRTEAFHRTVSYPTSRYLALVRTFSAYRALPAVKRWQMRRAVTRIVNDHAGTIDIDLATVLAMGRRPPLHPRPRLIE